MQLALDYGKPVMQQVYPTCVLANAALVNENLGGVPSV